MRCRRARPLCQKAGLAKALSSSLRRCKRVRSLCQLGTHVCGTVQLHAKPRLICCQDTREGPALFTTATAHKRTRCSHAQCCVCCAQDGIDAHALVCSPCLRTWSSWRRPSTPSAVPAWPQPMVLAMAAQASSLTGRRQTRQSRCVGALAVCVRLCVSVWVWVGVRVGPRMLVQGGVGWVRAVQGR